MKPVDHDPPRALPRLVIDDYSMPDPDCPATADAMYRARYAMNTLTQGDLYQILAFADAYQHFAGHVAPTRMLVEQLRETRRAVRERRRAGAGQVREVAK